MTTLVAIETALPAYRHRQADVTAAVVSWMETAGAGVDPRAVERLFSRAGVDYRSSLQPLDAVFRDVPFAERNEVYREAIIDTGVALSRRILDRVGNPAIGLIVSSSCTGFMIPAVDAYIANALKLGPRLARLPITESGCAGGAVALARAFDFVESHPESAALVVAAEFSSLTFQAREMNATNTVATALFADGASAAVLMGPDHPAARRRQGAAMLATASYFLPDTLGAMGYDVIETGFRLVLDKRLPDHLRGRLRPMIVEFLAEQGCGFDTLEAFAIHPGGRRVLDVASEELGLSEDQLEPSRSVLRDHGNMSSATLMFVLERALARTPAGKLCLGIGFGPGFSIELSLWRGAQPPA